jgi:hypothetical protein
MSNIAQRSFASGEIAPSLFARTDQVKYATGLRTCRNFIVMRHGGVTNRPGTRFKILTYANGASPGAGAVRLVRWVRSSTETFLLEFGNEYIRILDIDGVPVSDVVKVITGATKDDPCVLTVTGHGRTTGDVVDIAAVGGMTTLNGTSPTITVIDINSFSLDGVDSTGYSNYTTGGTVTFHTSLVTTPYDIDDIWDLQFAQSTNGLTIVGRDYTMADLVRHSATYWTLETIAIGSTIQAPTNLAMIPATGSGTFFEWVVTAVDARGIESLPSSAVGIASVSLPQERTLSWTASAGAISYNVYKGWNGVVSDGDHGFVGSTKSLSFYDPGIVPDWLDLPPVARNPFSTTDLYPGVVGYFQERRIYASSNTNPETVWTSRTADYNNFTISTPLQDDDAVMFNLAGRRINAVRHILDLGQLVFMTEEGEWVIGGDSSGILRPGEVNPKQYSYNGSNRLAPVIINDTALYVQARGTILRDLSGDVQAQGFKGSDLTIFSAHLFDGHRIVDLDYQQLPHSIVWVVRDDGILLGLTYIKEQQMWAWHRHDTDGLVENVCVLPDGDEDVVFLVVNRAGLGRCIERMASRFFTEISDAFFVDCGYTFDGRYAAMETDITMTLSGGTLWVNTETLTITASASFFTAGSVGNVVVLHVGDELVHMQLLSYTGATVMTGRTLFTVPVAGRATPITEWDYSIAVLSSGLSHLEGKEVSVLADGFVIASPNNVSLDTLTVTSGSITLDRPRTVVHVGLPYISDFETLDIDTADGPSLKGKKMLMSRVGLFVEKTRGLLVGTRSPDVDENDIIDGLGEAQMRDSHPMFIEAPDDPIALVTDVLNVDIERGWDNNGRIFARQIDPLPVTILSAIPQGMIPRAT